MRNISVKIIRDAPCEVEKGHDQVTFLDIKNCLTKPISTGAQVNYEDIVVVV